VTIFGALFFGEKPGKRVWGSLALCVAGAVLVVRDGSGSDMMGDIIAIGSSLFAGIAVNYVRRASTRGVDPFLLYLSPALFGLPILFFAPIPTAFPGFLPLLFLVGVGVGAFGAQALMAWGYRSVSASKGSVTFFLETGLTVLLGALFVGETLSLRFVLGLALIFAGLWYNRR
jgi:drug/metabolite transporter (DMT)-like permease